MFVYYFLIFTFGVFIRLVWIGRVEGFRNVPRKGRILIAPNHQSWIDAFFIGAVLNRRLYFLVGEHVYNNKFASWCVDQMGFIRVDRTAENKSSVYEQSLKLLSEGKALTIFPEGRMTRDGKIQKAYKGVARMALSSQTDIVPTVINSYHIYPVHLKWPKLFNGRCHIKFLKPLKYDDFRGLDPAEIVHYLLMPAIAKELKHEYNSDEYASK